MKAILVLGALLLLARAGQLHAEHGCPTGYVPVYQGNQQVCTVDYSLPSWQRQQRPTVADRAPLEDRWGAIAMDDYGHDGIVVDYIGELEAKEAAIEECEKRGGQGCEVMLAYHNQCAAVAANTSVSSISHASDKEQAKEIALRRCNAKKAGEACWIYYSGCSLPARVR